MWIKVGRRAARIEEKNRTRSDKVILTKEKQRKKRSKWEERRKKFYERSDIS